MPERKKEREVARRRQQGGVLTILLVVVLLAVAVAGGLAYYAYRAVTGPGPLEAATTVLLRPGASVAEIAGDLKAKGALRDPRFFRAAARVKGVESSLKAGEYAIPAGSSIVAIIDLLVEGKSILHSITAPEGLTTAQILAIVAEDPVLVGELTAEPAEGVLLPETYAFTRGETRDTLVDRMAAAQADLLDDIWPDRALELPFSTREEAIILASIVEKETGLPEERPRIAAVFVNRLKRGMRLESDPTVIYGLTEGAPLGRGLRASELRKETPYNTYVIKGLPPGPIANPGRDAIEAVLNPAETNEIFFVADGTGGHAFAETLREHNENVARWRRIERERASE